MNKLQYDDIYTEWTENWEIPQFYDDEEAAAFSRAPDDVRYRYVQQVCQKPRRYIVFQNQWQ